MIIVCVHSVSSVWYRCLRVLLVVRVNDVTITTTTRVCNVRSKTRIERVTGQVVGNSILSRICRYELQDWTWLISDVLGEGGNLGVVEVYESGGYGVSGFMFLSGFFYFLLSICCAPCLMHKK
jgi:hypothetical protein